MRLITERTGDGLAEYVFTLAIPFLLFRTIVDADLPPTLPWAYWTSYFVGVAAVWVISTLLARKAFDRPHGEGVVFGFAAGQANTVMVGVPLILKAFGDIAAAPLVLLLAIHLPVTMTAATLLFEGAGGGGRRAALRRIVRSIFTHPILIGIAARHPGARIRHPPDGLRQDDRRSHGRIGNALLARRHGHRARSLRRPGRMACGADHLGPQAGPASSHRLRHGARRLRASAVWAGVGLLFAACPSGINVYLFATRMRTGEATASAAVSLSTGLAVVTVTGWLYFLGVGQ